MEAMLDAGAARCLRGSGTALGWHSAIGAGCGVAIVVLGGLALAAGASASSPPPGQYTAAPTEACLKSLPNAITGLPPATPPAPAALFVYRSRPDRFPRSASGQLGAWYGHKRTGVYVGAILTFFKSVPAARAYLHSLLSPGSRIRNVVVDWGYAKVSEPGWRADVRGCVRGASAGGTRVPQRAIPKASLATFAGYWGGHGRGLRISPGGRAVEYANDGCCFRVYRLSFQILSLSGTLTRATAAYRVTSSRRYDRAFPNIHTGRIGTLLLRNGIVTNTLSKDFFCSDPAWGATEACGA
jgi:hypothetical protein